MKKVISFFSTVLLFINLIAQEEVKLKNGKTIIVNNDGTWIYKSANAISGTFKDPRDGKVYKTVKIGTQTWMAENLAYKASKGCWAYNNDEKNIPIYGRLYSSEVAKNVCPKGWHLPSDAEWATLTDYLGGEEIGGEKLKSTTGWNGPNTGTTNISGFSALPGGIRNEDGKFSGMGESANWWYNAEYPDCRELVNGYAGINRGNGRYIESGSHSIRAIKDSEAPSVKQEATLSEIYQTDKKIFSDKVDKIFTDFRLLTRMKKLMGQKNFENFQVMNLWGFKGDEVNSNYFFTYYNSCPQSCGTYGVIYGDIVSNTLIVGFINLDIKWFKENENQVLPQKLKDWLNAAQNNTLD